DHVAADDSVVVVWRDSLGHSLLSEVAQLVGIVHGDYAEITGRRGRLRAHHWAPVGSWELCWAASSLSWSPLMSRSQETIAAAAIGRSSGFLSVSTDEASGQRVGSRGTQVTRFASGRGTGTKPSSARSMGPET